MAALSTSDRSDFDKLMDKYLTRFCSLFAYNGPISKCLFLSDFFNSNILTKKETPLTTPNNVSNPKDYCKKCYNKVENFIERFSKLEFSPKSHPASKFKELEGKKISVNNFFEAFFHDIIHNIFYDLHKMTDEDSLSILEDIMMIGLDKFVFVENGKIKIVEEESAEASP